MNLPLLTLEVRTEPDIVLARQRARQIAALLGFAPLDQTRVATAVSEIARNAFQYAGGGRIEFLVKPEPAPGFLICVREQGRGIRDLQSIIEGRYDSSTGLGLGIVGAKRLMDEFEVESSGSGTTVTMTKGLPKGKGQSSRQEIARISAELAQHSPLGLLDELQLQNQELLRTLQELRDRQSEIAELHRNELEETNRGVVALYSELDENAIELRRISELKSRFLSNMSHEFRSPLNTILSMSGFLLDGSSGGLTPEQEKEVGFIRKAAEGLAALVNDLLDLAKVEAGKAVIRPETFQVADLFENLGGMTRPLLTRGEVSLIVEEPEGVPKLHTDEAKVAQILRNFLSNAAKFTQRGEIRLAAAMGPDDMIHFSVTDTGIGIAPEHQRLIFEEFGQVEGPVQKRVKGTGLGLPLSRKLAELLGGGVSVRSKPGVGSTFIATIPLRYPDPEPRDSTSGPLRQSEPIRPDHPGSVRTILIIDDREDDRYRLRERLTAQGRFAIVEATGGEEGLRRARADRPDIVFLDLVMAGMTGFEVLERMRSEDGLAGLPVIIHTSADLNEDERRGLAAGAVAILSKAGDSSEDLSTALRDALVRAGLDLTPRGAES